MSGLLTREMLQRTIDDLRKRPKIEPIRCICGAALNSHDHHPDCWYGKQWHALKENR